MTSLLSFVEHTEPITHLKVWGKSGWRFLMAIAMTYPITEASTQKRIDMQNFLVSIGSVLPCDRCSIHFRKAVSSTLDEHALRDRESLLRWMHAVQNSIRARQRREPVSFETMMMQCSTGCPNTSFIRCTHKQACTALVTIVALLLVYIVYIRRK